MSIVWRCDKCHQPINDDDGWLTVLHRDIASAEAAEREAELRAWAANTTVPDARAFMGPDDPTAIWHSWHIDCDPDRGSGAYWINVERVRTHAKLLGWTAHLMEKSWLGVTDWDDVIRKAISWQAAKTGDLLAAE